MSQQAWVQSTDVEKNIFFSLPKEKNLYEAVVQNCQINPDLKALIAGDKTQLSESVNLVLGCMTWDALERKF